MAKEKDEDADREPESKSEIYERRQEKAKISSRYREAERKLPDDPRDLRTPTKTPETRQLFGDLFDSDWSTSNAD